MRIAPVLLLLWCLTLPLWAQSVGPPPHITNSPVSQIVVAGTDVSFSVGVAQSQTTLSYQWLKGGANLPDATNPTLLLKGVQLTDGGAYSVVVTNVAGAAPRQNA